MHAEHPMSPLGHAPAAPPVARFCLWYAAAYPDESMEEPW